MSFFNLNIFINYRPECCIVKERNKRIQQKYNNRLDDYDIQFSFFDNFIIITTWNKEEIVEAVVEIEGMEWNNTYSY